MFFNLKLISTLLWLFASIAVIDLLEEEEEEDDTDQKLSCDEVFENCQETLYLIHTRHLVAMPYEFMKIKKETCVQCILDLFDEYKESYKHTSQLNNETNQSIIECDNNDKPICYKKIIDILNYHNTLIENADKIYRKTFYYHIHNRLNFSETRDLQIEIPKIQTGQSETNHSDLVVVDGEPKTEWPNNLVLIIINLGLFVISSGCGYFTQKLLPLSKRQPARFSQPGKPIANQQSTDSIDTDLLSPVQVMFVSVVLAMFYLLIYKLCAKHQSSQVQLMQGPQQSSQSQQPTGLAEFASNFNPSTISAANSTIKFPSTNLRKSQWKQSNSGLKQLSKFGGLKNK